MDFLPASERHESAFTRLLKLVAPVKRSEVVTVTLLALNCFMLLFCYYVVVREPLILLGGGAELKAYASAGQTILLLGVGIEGRLLVTLGVRCSLFIMPVIVLGGWFALILFIHMAVVRIEKTTENSLDYSLRNTLRQALFLPTSPEAKYKAKAAIDTFFFPMGDVVAGVGIVFLFVEVLGLGVRSFAALNVCLAALWIRTGRLHDKLVAEQQGNAPQKVEAPAA